MNIDSVHSLCNLILESTVVLLHLNFMNATAYRPLQYVSCLCRLKRSCALYTDLLLQLNCIK